jgi:hypothetical protein
MIQQSLGSWLCRTVFIFGSTTHGMYGHMTFSRDGRVTTRYNPAEYWYRLDDGVLSFMTEDMKVTSTVKFVPTAKSFIPGSGSQHFLHPVFELDDSEAGLKVPSVFVNTVPKAGTYLFASALEKIGYKNTNLHIMDQFLHDNRGVPAADIHFDPTTRQVNCPARAAAALMQDGEFMVGHLGEYKEVKAIHNLPIHLVNIIREPRSLLLSYFIFKKKKVKSSPEDALWKSMSGVDAFKAFLISAPLHQIMKQTRMISNNFSFLRYEDVRKGDVSAITDNFPFASHIQDCLPTVIGTETSTYIVRDSNETEDFLSDPWVKKYFEETGVMDLSREYWPEMN